jgi:gliding motility-associated-like protein
VIPDSIDVRNGCSATLAVSGFSIPTVNWTSINPPPIGAYNSYLSCTSGCQTVVVTPTGTPPPFVDYQVSGFLQAPCQSNFKQDTVRVYFYNDLVAAINPSQTTICFGSNTAVLTCTASGGKPPLTYSWSTGSTVQTVTVGPGTYTCWVQDATNCPPTLATAVVNQFTLPISANAGPDQTLCKTNPNATLNGTIVMAGGGIWSGGSGTIAPSNTVMNITYAPTPAEVSTGSVMLTLTSTGNQGCPGASDNVVLFFQDPPLANAGLNPTVCANNSTVNLSGAILNFSANPLWLSSGTGTFTAPTNLNTSYVPSAADVSAGGAVITLSTTNNGACPPSTSTLQLLITPAPVVSAGSNQTVCSTNTISLNGNIIGPTTTGFWSVNGTGFFSPSSNQPTTNYIPSTADINSGSLTFTLTSTGNGNCFAVTNTVNVAISKIATVSAGPNQAICANTNTFAISGSVTGVSSTGFWTSNGSGGYNPGQGFLNNTYFLSAADIAAGSVIFTLTSTNNGPCPIVADTVMMSIVPLATVNAGANQFICANQGTVALNGTVNTNVGAWTTSGGGPFFPNNQSLSTTYSLTAADIALGNVTFTLSSLSSGPCPVVRDSVKIMIKSLASVNAGPDQIICSNAGTIALNGSVTAGSTTGFWTSSGTGGYNPGPGFLNSNYFINTNDVANGTVVFTLSSTNNGPCPSINDTLMVTIISIAQVDAGTNQLICENQGTIALSGTVSTSNAVWNASGSGIFSPSNTNLTPTYSLTQNDLSAGFVTFTLSSTNNGPCPVVRDSTRINVRRIAVVNAGPDKQLCTSSSQIALNGSVSVGSTTGQWSTSGTGNFSPSSASLTASYIYSNSDVQTQTITMVLTSLNNGICPTVRDTMNLVIFKDPVITVLGDTSVCSYQNPIEITAGTTGNYGQLLWSSSATTGSFIPTIGANPVKYKFGFQEISAGNVTLTIALVNNGPCGNKSGNVHVNIRPAPVASFVASAYTVATFKEPISFTNESLLANSYTWDFGDGNQSHQTDPTHTFPGAGYYNIQLIATNQYNCADTTDQLVVVKSDIQFPNVFTPNLAGSNGGAYDPNDYSNDVFFPYTSGVTEYDLKIFNRYGELIFQSNDLKKGWDGYFNGKLSQQDGYVWKANVKFFDGHTYQGVGSVVLLR